MQLALLRNDRAPYPKACRGRGYDHVFKVCVHQKRQFTHLVFTFQPEIAKPVRKNESNSGVLKTTSNIHKEAANNFGYHRPVGVKKDKGHDLVLDRPSGHYLLVHLQFYHTHTTHLLFPMTTRSQNAEEARTIQQVGTFIYFTPFYLT